MSSPSSGRLLPIRTPLSTARKSRCVANLGESMLDRATRRATAKDVVPTGIPAASPKCVLLSEFLDSHFLSVASDSGLAFDSSLGSLSGLLSVIRANELAQAALAKAGEAAEAPTVPAAQVSAVDGSGHPNVVTASALPARVKRRRPMGLVAPTRSSLRIKNLSFK